MSRDDGGRVRWLWFLVGLGPIAWFVDLCVGRGIGPPAHRAQHLGLVRALHAGALAVVVAGVALAAREVMRLRSETTADAADVRFERTRLLAIAGLGLGALCALLVGGNLLAALLLAGEEP